MNLCWGKHTGATGIHLLPEEIGVADDAAEREPFKTPDPKQKGLSASATTDGR